ERLAHLLAWVRIRLAELRNEEPVARASSLLPWLLVGSAVRPDDAVLRAVVATQLINLDEKAAAVVYGTAAFEASREDTYVVEAALVALGNYYGDPEKI